jgi:flagellar biosynthetic protein FlhB
MAAAIGMVFMGNTLIQDLYLLLSGGLSFDAAYINDSGAMLQQLAATIRLGVIAIVPILILLVISAFIGPIAMGGWSFSIQALAPKLDKLDPLKGLARMVSLKSLVELIKAVFKFLLVASAATLIIYVSIQELLALGLMSVPASTANAGTLLLWAFIGYSSVLILVASIDVPFQAWQHKEQLKMTKQEVKDELKDTEGRPEVKSQIRRLQKDLSDQRMMQAVPSADVIITNPTHYAVALSYDTEGDSAPTVVAKGQDYMAQRIREVASEHAVPIFEAPSLARALYGLVKVGQEIPASLYKAVAKVLAYIFQLKELVGYEAGKLVPPREFDVPEQYRGGQP